MPFTPPALKLEDLARWLENATAAVNEERMCRLARAAAAARDQSHRTLFERRRRRRLIVNNSFVLTPVLADCTTPAGESFSVVGRQVSEGGFDFYSHEAIPYRHVKLVLSADDTGEHVVLVTQLRWCRFSTHGIYENGGVFVHQQVQRLAGCG